MDIRRGTTQDQINALMEPFVAAILEMRRKAKRGEIERTASDRAPPRCIRLVRVDGKPVQRKRTA